MNRHKLSEAEVEQYKIEGYVVLKSVFGPDDTAKVDTTIRQLTDRALSGDDLSSILELEPEPVEGQRVPRRIYDPFDQHETFRALATDPRVLDRIEQLIGPNINVQHSKLNMKPAAVGSVVEWHQDLAYFPHTNDDLVTTLIYLDEATEENGCLQVLPRHRHHFFDHHGTDGTFAGMITEEIADGRFGKPVPLPAPAGSVIFMHCILPHSSSPNRSKCPRRTLIFEYRAADSFPIYYGDNTAVVESNVRMVRGKPAQYARLGGPAPLIPRIKLFKSLYQLQEQSKTKVSTVKN